VISFVSKVCDLSSQLTHLHKDWVVQWLCERSRYIRKCFEEWTEKCSNLTLPHEAVRTVFSILSCGHKFGICFSSISRSIHASWNIL